MANFSHSAVYNFYRAAIFGNFKNVSNVALSRASAYGSSGEIDILADSYASKINDTEILVLSSSGYAADAFGIFTLTLS